MGSDGHLTSGGKPRLPLRLRGTAALVLRLKGLFPRRNQICHWHSRHLAARLTRVGAKRGFVETVNPARRARVCLLVAAAVEAARTRCLLHYLRGTARHMLASRVCVRAAQPHAGRGSHLAEDARVAAPRDNLIDAHYTPRARA